MYRAPIACLLVAFATSMTMANPGPTSDAIRDAIRDLDSPQFKTRSAATRKLLAAGKMAIDPLTRAAESGPIGVADRALKILEELAFKEGAESATTAQDALRHLAQSKTQARDSAREILRRQRGQLVDQMQKAGASFQFQGEKVRAIYLDSVDDLKRVLPLLREFPELEELSLSTRKFGDAEMEFLLPLNKLKWINLFESNIGDESLKLLKHFPDIESIPMGRTRVTDAGMKHLSDLKGLVYLGLRGNNITDAGLDHLKKLTNLTALTLQETKITDAGLVRLREMTRLNHLRLQSTAITDAGLEKLHPLKSLRRIDLEGARITGKGVEELRKAIPEATIITRDGE